MCEHDSVFIIVYMGLVESVAVVLSFYATLLSNDHVVWPEDSCINVLDLHIYSVSRHGRDFLFVVTNTWMARIIGVLCQLFYPIPPPAKNRPIFGVFRVNIRILKARISN